MAVDYTKVYTIIGCDVDKVINRYASVAAENANQEAIEDILIAQDEVRLVEGLEEVYDKIRQHVADDVSEIIGRVTNVLTDNELVVDQFPLGTNPGVQGVMVEMIRDMVLNDKNVAASVATLGAVTKETVHADCGQLKVGDILDGVTPPIAGAIAIKEYADVVTQMTPASESIAVTCTIGSEDGAARGSETFEITGTGEASEAYSASGENLGVGGTIQVADNGATQFITNPSFDDWPDNTLPPTGWLLEDGAIPTNIAQSSNALYGGGGDGVYSLATTSTTANISLVQNIPSSRFQRLKSYYLAVWAKKTTDAESDQELTLALSSGSFSVLLTVEPTTTDWQLFAIQFVVPAEIEDNVQLSLTASLSTTTDGVELDQMVIAPCQYVAGVALAIFGGESKFIRGDRFLFTLSNDEAGKFQTFFRKAYKIQLPTDATPTISDSLVT